MKQQILTIILLCLVLFNDCFAATNSEKQKLSVPQLKEDLTQLYNGLRNAHINLFANISQKEYQKAYQRILSSFDTPLSQLDAHIEFQKFVSLGDVAHARIDFPTQQYADYRDGGGTAFPVYVSIDQGRWYINEDYSGHSLSNEHEVISIDGKSVGTFMEELRVYISADTNAIAESLLEFQLPQYIWLRNLDIGQKQNSLKLKVIRKNETKSIDVQFITADELSKRSSVNTKANRQSEGKLRDFKMLANKIAYLKPGPFYNAEDPGNVWDNAAFKDYIDQSFDYFLSNESEKLIIDVRKNPGGDNSFSDHLIAWYADKPFKFASKFLIRSSAEATNSNAKRLELDNDVDSASNQLAKRFNTTPYGELFEFEIGLSQPHADRHFSGEVYVLIDRHSYSNAASVAAITQDYGFGTIAGEATTDFATTYGSMETFQLKNSGIVVGFPKSHIIRPSGDTVPGPVLPDWQLKRGGRSDQSADELLDALLNKIK